MNPNNKTNKQQYVIVQYNGRGISFYAFGFS